MAGTDPWNGTDQLDDTVLDAMATRLEARARNDMFVSMLDDYLEAMDIDNATTVLDLGCGTGVAARRICARPNFAGTCLGIDLSDYLVCESRRIAAEEGIADKVRFDVGDTNSLELADGAFDAAIAHTLVSHVDDPLSVLAEMKRVVRPGGGVAVFDGDYASMTFEQEDEAKSKADSEKKINAVVTQPRVMRQMPRLAKKAGLRIERTFSYVLTEVGKADFWASSIEGFRKLGPRSGLMTQEEADAWADRQVAASDEGVFFGSSNYYGYVLRSR